MFSKSYTLLNAQMQVHLLQGEVYGKVHWFCYTDYIPAIYIFDKHMSTMLFWFFSESYAFQFKCKLICRKRKLMGKFTGFTVVLDIYNENYVSKFKCKVGAKCSRFHLLKKMDMMRM